MLIPLRSFENLISSFFSPFYFFFFPSLFLFFLKGHLALSRFLGLLSSRRLMVMARQRPPAQTLFSSVVRERTLRRSLPRKIHWRRISVNRRVILVQILYLFSSPPIFSALHLSYILFFYFLISLLQMAQVVMHLLVLAFTIYS